jgi:ribonucleotide monophosphatase NagD (HAD superfamily)
MRTVKLAILAVSVEATRRVPLPMASFLLPSPGLRIGGESRMVNQDVVLISAPNAAGEQFMKLLKEKKILFAAIVNNPSEYKRIAALGAEHIIIINTTKEDSWIIPEVEVGKVYLFERSVTLCCRYAQICRSWTSKSIYVITGSHNPRHVYKGLGVNYVIHSNAQQFEFLLTEDLKEK